MIALLVRHGQTQHTSSGRYLGVEDVPLDTVGRKQASAVAPVIASFAPDGVICSPMVRAIQTLALIAPDGPEMTLDERLREVGFGPWEGLRPDEVAASDPTTKTAFDTGEMDILPGGESTDDAADRVAAAIRDQLDQRSRLLVVGHNTALRLGIARLLGLPSRRYRVTFDTLRPCHWAELDLSAASGPRLVAYNTTTLAGS